MRIGETPVLRQAPLVSRPDRLSYVVIQVCRGAIGLGYPPAFFQRPKSARLTRSTVSERGSLDRTHNGTSALATGIGPYAPEAVISRNWSDAWRTRSRGRRRLF